MAAYLRRAYSSFLTHVIDIPPRLLSLLFLLLLACTPVVLSPTSSSVYFLGVLITANIMAIFASSWDLLVGRAGQISLGHALFFGIGAYTSALLLRFVGFPLWVTIPVGVLVGTLAAVPVGFPCMRVKGPYLALVTMALPLIATGIIYYFRDPWTGGEQGLPVPRFFPFIANLYQQRVAEYYLTLIALFVSAIAIYKIANSKTGIVFLSVLDDEVGSKACGINVTKYKLLAFALSALFASLAGSIQAPLIYVASPAAFSLNLSFYAIIITIFGGIGTIYGAIAASYIIYFLDQYVLTMVVNVPTEWHPLIFIVVVIIFVVKWPRGVARFVVEDGLKELSKEREIEERGKRIWKKYKRKTESTPED
jgi:branched-chain amino acid transport system permease protein